MQPQPAHCQACNVDGRGCSEFRGLQWCYFLRIWYCPRHHRLRQQARVFAVAHTNACDTPEARRKAARRC